MNTRITQGIAHSVAVLFLFIGPLVSAADIIGDANGISLSKVSSSSQSVRVTGPNGYSNVSSGASLRSSNGAPLADGLYKYEVTETKCVIVSYAEMSEAKRDNVANGRDPEAQPSSCRDVVVDSGAFRIVNGAVPNRTQTEE